MNKQTRQQHQNNKAIICSIRSINELGKLLKTHPQQLKLMAQQPSYKTFTIPKKGGGERQIENPSAPLKKVLSQLNGYLQSTYFFEKSNAAYGFVSGVRNDDDRRNVLTNAQKHLGRPYLLNIDLKDFFHSVSRGMVLQIFLEKPFRFKGELADLLADLCTYQERLPMGTPTSPTLSNFACRSLDDTLQAYATNMLWVYTRYADDMSFSSHQKINEEMIHSVKDLITQAGFRVNPRKVTRSGPEDAKIVTGLLLTDKVGLAPDFLPQLRSEVNQLAAAVRAQNEQGQLSTRWLTKMQQQVRGRISFAGFVLGRRHEQYMEIRDAFYTATNPPQEEFGAMSWRGFPYNF